MMFILHPKHRLHPPFEKKSYGESNAVFQGYTRILNYYPYNNNKKRNCDLQHVYNWIKLFIYLYNAKNKKQYCIQNWRRHSLKLTQPCSNDIT